MIERLLNKAKEIIAAGNAEALPGAAFQLTCDMTIDECEVALLDHHNAKRWLRNLEAYKGGGSDWHINHFRHAVADAITQMDARQKAIAARAAWSAKRTK